MITQRSTKTEITGHWRRWTTDPARPKTYYVQTIYRLFESRDEAMVYGLESGMGGTWTVTNADFKTPGLALGYVKRLVKQSQGFSSDHFLIYVDQVENRTYITIRN